MRSFIKTFFIASATIVAVFGFAFTTFAAGNIDNASKYSQFVDTDLDNNLTKDLINWMPTNGGATVTDTGIDGYIWGETIGWVRMDPSHGGVTNTCDGQLGGYAWGENAGWINFDPDNALVHPHIDINTGEISGQVWAQNYGWIELASTEPGFTGLVTSWRPSPHCDDVVDPPGGSSPTLKIYKHVQGGTAHPEDFKISVKEEGVEIPGSPFQGSANGMTVIVNTDEDRSFVISEQSTPDYTGVFSGDCAPYGVVTFKKGDTLSKTCNLVNFYKMEPVYGCKIPGALNYISDPNVLPKNSLCQYDPHSACKNPEALNYNPDPDLATDNSKCKFKEEGKDCKIPEALNYNPDPNVEADNDLCQYKDPETACKNPDALNYDSNPKVGEDNTKCRFSSYVCKDPLATNYDPSPNKAANNDLCEYPDKNPPDYKWWLVALGLMGLASTIPGIVVRTAHMLLTFVWGRKKIRGVVYDTNTEEPVDPVYLSVIDLATNQEVKNQLTDMEGRFGFVLPKGHYKIVASKTNYVFPSAKLAGRVSDEVYDRLYFGEPFTVENEDQVVTMNIPMDPTTTDWNQAEKHKTSFIQYLIKGQTKYAWLFNALFVVGFLASIMITYFYPGIWNYVMTGLYVILGLIQVYGYGPIYAGKVTRNGMPLAGAIVRAWNPTLNHEVGKRVTEVSGGYYIIVPKADYFVTIDQKNQDGTFTRIFTSTVFHARHGCIDKKFNL
jgi:hypothetical protein